MSCHQDMALGDAFWEALDRLLAISRLVVDRAAASSHPHYPDLIYPLDYGYLQDTQSMDGDGINVWIGSDRNAGVTGVVVTVDLTKRDAEIKILLDCTSEQMERIHVFHSGGMQSSLLLTR